MDEKFKEYDGIVATIIQWLIEYSKVDDRPICLTHFYWDDDEDLCILSIVSMMKTILDKNVYVKTNWFNYIGVKYLSGFKFLKRAKFDLDAIEINIHNFENEILIAMNKHPSILAQIYHEYYKR